MQAQFLQRRPCLWLDARQVVKQTPGQSAEISLCLDLARMCSGGRVGASTHPAVFAGENLPSVIFAAWMPTRSRVTLCGVLDAAALGGVGMKGQEFDRLLRDCGACTEIGEERANRVMVQVTSTPLFAAGSR